jgi:YD repeat-containing protein
VRNAFGHFIRFEYDSNGLLTAAVTSAGNRTTYLFDPNTRTLASVTFPGGAQRSYSYDTSAPRRLHLLTGITDELGNAYASYAYDDSQRPVATQLAGGVNRFEVRHTANAWNGNAPMRVTGPTGVSADVGWRGVGPAMPSWPCVQTTEALAGFSAAIPGLDGWWQSSENDANGNITLRCDFDGRVTRASYALARNLETQRIDDADTALAAESNIEWHPDWRLPARKSEPGLITTVLYNGQTYNGQPINCAPAGAQIAG